MGRKKIEVSRFALTVSKAVRAQMGMRRMTNRDLAEGIGRGVSYVRERVVDEKEWGLGDIERMCMLWNMSPEKLIGSTSLAGDIGSDPDAADRHESVQTRG